MLVYIHNKLPVTNSQVGKSFKKLTD